MPLQRTAAPGRPAARPNILDDRTAVIRLADAYAGVLTARQRALLGMYYHEDLSLGEIAERRRVTRQAVFDSLRRAVGEMRRLEDRLGLLAHPGEFAKMMRSRRYPARPGPSAPARQAGRRRDIRIRRGPRAVRRHNFPDTHLAGGGGNGDRDGGASCRPTSGRSPGNQSRLVPGGGDGAGSRSRRRAGVPAIGRRFNLAGRFRAVEREIERLAAAGADTERLARALWALREVV